jgi:cytochrome c
MRPILFASILAVSALHSVAAPAGPIDDGRDIALRLCAPCHAVGPTGSSPNAAAPAFRQLDARSALDDLPERLTEGILAGHPDMPVFRLTRREARSLVLYLRSIQADRPR